MATAITALIIFITDQLSKDWIRRSFMECEQVVVIKNFFNITYIRNEGGAFGVMPDRQLVFVIMAVVTIFAIAWCYRRYTPQLLAGRIAIGMVLGGAVGNLADRILMERGGCVTDWLDFYWGRYHWPAFNVADAGISAGVMILLYMMILKVDNNSKEVNSRR